MSSVQIGDRRLVVERSQARNMRRVVRSFWPPIRPSIGLYLAFFCLAQTAHTVFVGVEVPRLVQGRPDRHSRSVLILSRSLLVKPFFPSWSDVVERKKALANLVVGIGHTRRAQSGLQYAR
ncbi:hypothetical protein AJ87_15130 [Rhizobium yanglingense]|nr:hypothetical protein AJ87_15130 [Rhizobium yanglingense]